MTGATIKKSGYVALCYEEHTPKLSIVHPVKDEIISDNFTIKSYGEYAPDRLMRVTCFLDDFTSGQYKRYYVGAVNVSSGGYFNLIANSSHYPDRNCRYAVYAYGNFSSCTTFADSFTEWFTINNVNMPPKWNNFKNNITTNFSQFSSWVNLTNVTVGIPGVGKIEFLNATLNFDDADLDSYLQFRNNYLNIMEIPCISDHLYYAKPFVTFYNISKSYRNPKVFRNGVLCPQTACPILNYSNGTVVFQIKWNGPAQYTVKEFSYAVLNIFDDTDGIRNYYVNEPVTFYANLVDNVTGKPIYGANTYCLIKFYLDYENQKEYYMSYNHETGLWEFTRSFPHPNRVGYNDEWGVYCNATSLEMGEAGWLFSRFEITNRGPVLVTQLPNETWATNTVLIGRDLDDYFVDPDNDPLNYSVQEEVTNIFIDINDTTHIVTYIPSRDWYGNRTVVFVARDPFNYSANSNRVFLEVVRIPIPKKPKETPSVQASVQLCKPDWKCGNWSECNPNGIQTRECIDLNNCNVSFWVPEMVRNCTYFPTCDDHIKNGGEEGVDCGGPCPPCPTCYDGIKNQGEQGIDCGGPCLPCPTCNDGIKNGDEEGVDCGGPCPPCEKAYTLEKPKLSRAFWVLLLLSIGAALGLTLAVKTYFSKQLGALLSLLNSLLRRKPSVSLFEAYVEPYLSFMHDLDNLRATKNKELLKNIVTKFFTLIFGDYDNERLDREFLAFTGLPFELVSKLRKLNKELFIKVTKEEVDKLLKQTTSSVRETFLNLFVSSGLSYQDIFHNLYKLALGLKDKDKPLFEIATTELYYVYLKLPLEDKRKLYKKLKELEQDKKMSKKKKKALAFFVLLIALAVFSFLTTTSITSYSVFNYAKELIVEELPIVKISAGNTYTTRIIAEGNQPIRYYSESSDVFVNEKTGVLRVSPNSSQLGNNFAIIKVIDRKGNQVELMFKYIVVP